MANLVPVAHSSVGPGGGRARHTGDPYPLTRRLGHLLADGGVG